MKENVTRSRHHRDGGSVWVDRSLFSVQALLNSLFYMVLITYIMIIGINIMLLGFVAYDTNLLHCDEHRSKNSQVRRTVVDTNHIFTYMVRLGR